MKYISSKKLTVMGLLLILNLQFVEAQINSVGTPYIRNYSRNDYQAGQQNWMISQGVNGRMYFANNDGLLEFDGLNWNVYPLPNGTIVRSLFVSESGKIYIGGYNEFGYFEPDSIGGLTFFSLMEKLSEEDRNFDEIWRIHNTPDGLIFQSFKQLIILLGDNIDVVDAPGTFHFSFFVNGQLLLVDLEKGMYRYTMNNFFPLPGTQEIRGMEINSVLPLDDKLLFTTVEKGPFVYDGNTLTAWQNESADFLRQNQVFSAISIDNEYYAFGTIQNGLLIGSKDGKPIHKINRLNGLQNNTILSLFNDRSGNLWLGSDNGIDYIEINSPLSFISYEQGVGAGYAANLFKGNLYLGTNQGVFVKPWQSFVSQKDTQEFQLIENTGGQVWLLKVLDDRLFCGAHNGTFIIEGNKARKISEAQGAWNLKTIPGETDKIIGGNYAGLMLLEFNNGDWEMTDQVKGFNESSRIFEVDNDGTIWMSHGFKGVYHIYLNDSYDSVTFFKFYNKKHGFFNDIGINVTRLDDDIHFSASDGLYTYDSESDSFLKSNELNELMEWNDLALLKEDQSGNIWYFDQGEAGVLRKQEDGGLANINLPFKPFRDAFISGFEFVYPINDQNVLFGASDGFIHYNPQIFKDYQQPFNTFVNRVSLFNPDSVIYAGHIESIKSYVPSIDFRNNRLLISFSSNDFENSEKTLYSTFLQGYDSEWTGWDTRTSREFTNLYEDDYIFYVKAKNIYGVETAPAIFRFEISPPWERSSWAIAIYAILGLVLIGVLIFFIRKKIERSRLKEMIVQKEKFKEREDKFERERLEAEKEIIRLRNEKLREQMVVKDKELANSTLDMIQKNKLLNKIKSDLKNISTTTNDETLKGQIHSLTKKINRELDTEKQWEVFETHFEHVHEAFLKRLKATYPSLSPRELKLCAYLRLNISSKEIAALMNISTRGVEISRYRLRKKLNLSRNDNLTDFILSF